MRNMKKIVLALIVLITSNAFADDISCRQRKIDKEQDWLFNYNRIAPSEKRKEFDDEYRECLCGSYYSSKATELREAIESNITKKMINPASDEVVEVPVPLGSAGYIIMSERRGKCNVAFVADEDLCEQIAKFEAVIDVLDAQKTSCEYTLKNKK